MILITGSNGMLGTYLLKELQAACMDFEAPSRKELNLLSANSINDFFVGKSYDSIIHLAAETNVDLCEREPHMAYLINSLATEKIALHARNMGALMIFISTSAIFGGVVKLRYSELDFPMPINLYGNSKLLGEHSIRRLCPEHHFIIRSSWMVGGGSQKDSKFISKILPNLKLNKHISAVHDKLGSLTYAKELAIFIINAYQKRLIGTQHFSSKDTCNRFEIASFLADCIGSTSIITPIDSQIFPLSAPRAISESLYSISPENIKTSTWKEIIKDYIKEWL